MPVPDRDEVGHKLSLAMAARAAGAVLAALREVPASELTGEAGITSYTDASANGPGPYFYRVAVQTEQRPFLYATNGTIVWHLDTRPAKRVSRNLADFHTPDALGEMFSRDTAPSATWLTTTPPERIDRLRPYQKDCILAVEQQVIGGRREMLVAMASKPAPPLVTNSPHRR